MKLSSFIISLFVSTSLLTQSQAFAMITDKGGDDGEETTQKTIITKQTTEEETVTPQHKKAVDNLSAILNTQAGSIKLLRERAMGIEKKKEKSTKMKQKGELSFQRIDSNVKAENSISYSAFLPRASQQIMLTIVEALSIRRNSTLHDKLTPFEQGALHELLLSLRATERDLQAVFASYVLNTDLTEYFEPKAEANTNAHQTEAPNVEKVNPEAGSLQPRQKAILTELAPVLALRRATLRKLKRELSEQSATEKGNLSSSSSDSDENTSPHFQREPSPAAPSLAGRSSSVDADSASSPSGLLRKRAKTLGKEATSSPVLKHRSIDSTESGSEGSGSPKSVTHLVESVKKSAGSVGKSAKKWWDSLKTVGLSKPSASSTPQDSPIASREISPSSLASENRDEAPQISEAPTSPRPDDKGPKKERPRGGTFSKTVIHDMLQKNPDTAQ